MEILQTAVADLWEILKTSIDWIVVLAVIISGYIVAKYIPFTKLRKGLKVLISGAISSGLYAFWTDVSLAKWFISFFFAFAVHEIVLRNLADLGKVTLLGIRKTLGGSVPPDDDEKS